MSVTSTAIEPILIPTTNTVTVQLPDGRIVSAIRSALYQVDPRTGESDIVLGSLKYEDSEGRALPGAVLTPNCPQLPSRRTWFFSQSGAPIYNDGDRWYNADGTPFDGTPIGYQTAGDTYTTYNYYGTPGTINKRVWAKYGNTYVPLNERTTTTPGTEPGDNPTTVVTYLYNGQVITPNTELVDTLPPSIYQDAEERLQQSPGVPIAAVNAPPTAYPISGVTMAWRRPLPTINNPNPGTVRINGEEPRVSNTRSINAEDPLGVVIPPVVQVTGAAEVDIAYRQRIAPLIAVGDNALNLLTNTPQIAIPTPIAPDSPSSVEPDDNSSAPEFEL